MKKLAGFAILSALLIVPAAVWAFGWGGHMMDWGDGPGYYAPNGSGYYGLNEEQQGKLADLNRKFYETQDLDGRAAQNELEARKMAPDTPFSGGYGYGYGYGPMMGGYGMGYYGGGYGPGACWN